MRPQIVAPCRKCQTPHKTRYPARPCPDCEKAEEDRCARAAAAQLLAYRERAWFKIIPSTYAETDRKKLPRPELFDQIMDWKFGWKGLLLHGATGLGKSRCAWRLCERQFMSNRSVGVIDGVFVMRIPHLCREDRVFEALESLIRPDIVLLDDAFKGRLTPSVEDFIFTLIEQRTAQGRPSLITTNDDAATLKARLSPDRGDPFIRRLGEFFEPIKFV